MDVRRDAFIAAARSAIAFRDDAGARDDVRSTTGFVNVSPAIVTAFNGWCEMSLDQRALDASVLASMLDAAQEATARIATEEGVSVEWERLWRIEPIPFDEDLISLAEEACNEVAGQAHRLPSGPLHDAAEMARLMPTVMLFVKSLRGLSHTKDEDTHEKTSSSPSRRSTGSRERRWSGRKNRHRATGVSLRETNYLKPERLKGGATWKSSGTWR